MHSHSAQISTPFNFPPSELTAPLPRDTLKTGMKRSPSVRIWALAFGIFPILGSLVSLASATGSTDPEFPNCPVSTNLQNDFTHIPVRDQGTTGICYAESAAQLLDFWRCRRNPSLCSPGLNRRATSAISVAIAHKKQGDNLDSGTTEDALRAILGPPAAEACTQEDFARSLGETLTLIRGDITSDPDIGLVQPYASRNVNNPREFRIGTEARLASTSGETTILVGVTTYPGIRDLLADAEIRCAGDADSADYWQQNVIRAYEQRYSCTLNEERRNSLFRTINDTIEALLPCDPSTGTTRTDSYFDWVSVLRNATQNHCPAGTLASEMGNGGTPPYRVYSTGTYFSADGGINTTAPFRTVERALASGIPVEVGICASVFNPPGRPSNPSLCSQHSRQVWASTHSNAKLAASASKFPGHSVLVIGARLQNGKCEYLLRNSWGPDCGGYDRCNTPDGTHWIPAAQVRRAMLSASYIVPDGVTAPATGATLQ